MSSPSSKSSDAPTAATTTAIDRRASPRRRFERLTYAEFGPENGGILIDISETGARFQSVEPVVAGELLPVSFVLTGSVATIKAAAKVVWCNESGKGGGLRFVDLSEAARHQIAAWVESDPEPVSVSNGNHSHENGHTRYMLPTASGHVAPAEPTSDAAAMAMARLLVSARGTSNIAAKPGQSLTPPDNARIAATDPDARPEALFASAPIATPIYIAPPSAPAGEAPVELSVESTFGPSLAPAEPVVASEPITAVEVAPEPEATTSTTEAAGPEQISEPVAAEIVLDEPFVPELPAALPEVPEVGISSGTSSGTAPYDAQEATSASDLVAASTGAEVPAAAPAQSTERAAVDVADRVEVRAEIPEVPPLDEHEPAPPTADSDLEAVARQQDSVESTAADFVFESQAGALPAITPAQDSAPAASVSTSKSEEPVESASPVLPVDEPVTVQAATASAPERASMDLHASDARPAPSLTYGQKNGKNKHKQKRQQQPTPARPNPMGLPSLLAPSAAEAKREASIPAFVAPKLATAPLPKRVIPRWGEQVLRFSVGVGVGCCIVAGTFVGIRLLGPDHRAFSLTHARSEAVEAAAAPAAPQPIEVEVLDLNGHRWRLSDVDTADIPTAPQPPSGEITGDQAAAPADPASASATPPAPVGTPHPDAKAQLVPKPVAKSESRSLALKRPLASGKAAAGGDLRAPSILEGVAPAISSALSVPDAHAPAPATSATPAPAPTAAAPDSSSRPVFPSMNAPQPEHHSSTLQAPVLLQQVNPVYPPQARSEHVTGTVRVNAIIGKEGVPHTLHVLSGDPRLAPAAIAAVSKWLYRPAQMNGEAIETEVTVDVQFQLH